MRRIAVAVVALFALAACGQSKPAISGDASKALQAKVAQIRVSASNHDASAVRAELAALRNQVTDLRQSGQLSADAAHAILGAIAAVDQNLSLITTTTTAPPEHGHGNGKSDEGGD